MAPASPAEHDELRADDEALLAQWEVLVVRIGDAAYALPSALIREVARAVPITAMPGVHAWVRGLCAVRGVLMPVADLAARAGGGTGDAPAGTLARDGWMVVVDDGRRAAALVGIRVQGVARARIDDATTGAASMRDAAGLPVRGDARLIDVGRRSAGAGPVRLARRSRTRDAAPPMPASPAHTEERSVAVLDVSALLHDLYDDGG